MTALQQATEFLRCILPSEGYYVAVIFRRTSNGQTLGPPSQQVCSTVEQLAETLLAGDAAGHTVFHACASFREPHGGKVRGHENALAARSLWADVDCGEGKPYVDQQAGCEAVLVFCHNAGLPVPLFVGSGRGLHIYWPLAESLTPEIWRGYALGLKALCTQYGLKIDPARTSDISSILRTPGTHWRKDGEREVRWNGRTGSHAVRQFSKLLGNEERRPENRHTDRESVSARIFSGSSFSAAYADPIADGCVQLARLRRSGQMPEPDWYACLGVLAYCEDGEARAHEWSARDFKRYSPVETGRKLQQTKALSGATTCQHFEGLNAGGCHGCTHRRTIKSPISLGYRSLGEGHPQRDNGTGLSSTFNNAAVSTVNGQVALPPIPKPFFWKNNKLCFDTEDQDRAVHITITNNPVFLDGVQTGEIDGTLYSYRFKKWLPKDGWSEIVVDASVLHGPSGISTMFGKGVVVHDPKLFLNYVKAVVDEYHENLTTQTRYDQFGWKSGETSFLFGKMLYTAAGPVEAIGGREVSARCQWLGPSKEGHVATWTDAADQLFGRDKEAVSAMVLASYAAPLMRFQSIDEGGAILHLHTPESGQGKTTALMGAWTVWGTRNGLNLTNEDTAVSKNIALGAMGNLPVIYDELRNKDPEVIKRFVVMFTEGRDRMRGTTDGTIRHTKASWQTVLLSASNHSLVDILQGDGTDAPAFRVLELNTHLPKDVDKAQGDRLKRVLNDNAGWAGDAYLRYLTQPDTVAWVREALKHWTHEIWGTTKLTSEHRFRVRLVGAIAVAATLVNKLDLLHFQTDRIVEWLVKELGSGRNEGSISLSTSLERAVNGLGEFINEHYGTVLVVPDRFRPQHRQAPVIKPYQHLIMRYEIKTERVYIQESVFREWCIKKQLSPRVMLTLLKDNGAVLEWRRPITLSAGTDIPGAQVLTVVCNAQHPALSGIVQAVEDAKQQIA